MQGLSKTRSELPEMLVLDILAKLPVKSLIRFKCVCKPWSSSFQTPLFITQHHHNNLRNNNLNILFKRSNGSNYPDFLQFSLFQLSTEKGQNFSLKQNILLPFFDDRWRSPQVYGPCNGILCVESQGNIALWNPSTRQFKILLQSSVQRPPSAYCTRFDGLGFGYDSQTDDYKVIRFVKILCKYDSQTRETRQVELYSLKGNSWNEISDPGFNALSCPWYDNHVNGICYWSAYRVYEFGIDDHCILSFDMVNERFSTLSFPEFDVQSGRYDLRLLNFNALLGAIYFTRISTLKSFELWVMSGSWTKLSSIESIPRFRDPLGFWKNGELFYENLDGEFMLFDPSTGEHKNLGIHDYYMGSMNIIAYAESLVTFNGRSEHGELVIRRPAGFPSN